MKKNKTPEASDDKKELEHYSVKEELERLRLFNSVLKEHCCEAASEAKSNAKKPEK